MKITKVYRNIFIIYIYAPTEWTATFLMRLFLYVSSNRAKYGSLFRNLLFYLFVIPCMVSIYSIYN